MADKKKSKKEGKRVGHTTRIKEIWKIHCIHWEKNLSNKTFFVVLTKYFVVPTKHFV